MLLGSWRKLPDEEWGTRYLTYRELAGPLTELSYNSIKGDFRNIDLSEIKIILLEAVDRVLQVYPPDLSARTTESLTRLGVTVRTNTMVTENECQPKNTK
ncbi:MAG: FAD-dependent oxidoreductase [Anaerolineae bacterium]|nr:FAD-dependent oxidoreductase [Anaerolineae bacterium]